MQRQQSQFDDIIRNAKFTFPRYTPLLLSFVSCNHLFFLLSYDSGKRPMFMLHLLYVCLYLVRGKNDSHQNWELSN